MIAGISAGRRSAPPGDSRRLPGALALLLLAATIPAVTASRPAAAARSGHDWVTSWSASPQDPIPGTLGKAWAFTIRPSATSSSPRAGSLGCADERLWPVAAAGRRGDGWVTGMGAGVVPGRHPPCQVRRRRAVRIPAGAQAVSDRVAHAGPGPAGPGGEHLPAGPDRQADHAPGRPAVHLGVDGGRPRGRDGARPPSDPDQVLVLPQRRRRRSSGRGRDRGGLRRLDHRRLQSTVDANARWPNDLARRLARAAGRGSRWSTRASAATSC